jgi:hypothetical protein
MLEIKAIVMPELYDLQNLKKVPPDWRMWGRPCD